MKRKVLSTLVLATAILCSTVFETKAVQNENFAATVKRGEKAEVQVSEKLRDYAGEEEIHISEEEMKQMDEEYRELELFYNDSYESGVCDCEQQNNSIETFGISNYANTTSASASATSECGILYTGGTATGTSIRFEMRPALAYSYSIKTSSSSSKYTFGSKITDSFVVPGMVTTNVKVKNCTDMIPQGMVYANGYIFISAYCQKEEHNSVLYVINSNSKQYVTTLVLVGKPHAGGLAYSNNCLWVCTGYDDGKGQAILYYYNVTDIVKAVKRAKENTSCKSVDISNINYGKVYLKNQSKCSFITAKYDYLYVGEYYESEKGTLGTYYANASDGAILTATLIQEVPKITQGMAWYENSSNKYLLFTASSGIYNNSNVYIYRKTSSGTSYTYYKTIEMPGMIEQPMVYSGKTYFVFESCSKYWGTLKNNWASTSALPAAIVGKACGFDNNFIY